MSKSKRNPGQIPGLGVFVTFEQVYSQGARHRDLVNYVERFPAAGFISMLCGIGAILHNDNEPTPFAMQAKFAHEFAKGVPGAKKIIEILRENPDGVVVHDEQLAVLIKYGLLGATADKWPDDAADTLVRLLLVYNSLHGKEFEPRVGDFESFARFELRSVFNMSEHLGAVIARYSSFFDWARTSEKARTSKNRLDLDADFLRFYGMTYEEWAASAFTILTYFRQITSVQAMETNKPVLYLDAYLAAFAEDTPIWKWLVLNTVSVAEAKKFFEKTKDDPSYSGVTLLPFMRRPLLGIDERNVSAPYLPYLENSLGSGVYFALLDGYNDQPGRTKEERKADSDMFTRYFGEFFEDYIVDLIRASHPTPHLVFGERKYVTEEGTEGNATDLVIFEGESALFIDISASRFNVTKTLIDLDPEFIRKDMEKIIVCNAEQLDKSIRAFRDGRLSYNGVSPSTIQRIYPIVLTIQPVPRAFAFNRRALDEIERRGLLRETERLEILTAEDAEGLGAFYAGGILLSDVLARKFFHPHPKAQNDSLKNYLFYFEPETLKKAVRPTTQVDKSPWIDSVMSLVKKWMGTKSDETGVTLDNTEQ